jgi:hypothetical protein
MSPPIQIHSNPGWLKLELMAKGLSLSPGTREIDGASREDGCGPSLFGNVRDLDLILPGGMWASVPVVKGLLADTPYTLVAKGERHHIEVRGSLRASIPVEVRPPSRLMEYVTASGRAFRSFGTVHGPYMALSPSDSCTFLSDADRCGFCGVGQSGAVGAVPVEDIVEVVRMARSEHRLDMVVLSVGHLGTDDGGVTFLEPYLRAIKKHFDILVGVDALPPSDDVWIDHTYGMGADAVSYNLELFDETRFEEVCPGIHRTIGRQRFLDALEYAASVFPSGATSCHLMVGLEPVDATRAGIDRLTAIGVLPVLPVYRPFKGRDLRFDDSVRAHAPRLEELGALYAHLYRAVRARGINLNVVRDVALATTPLDARFFAEEDSRFSSWLHRLQGTGGARRFSALMSDLRRAIRVQPIEGAESS